MGIYSQIIQPNALFDESRGSPSNFGHSKRDLADIVIPAERFLNMANRPITLSLVFSRFSRMAVAGGVTGICYQLCDVLIAQSLILFPYLTFLRRLGIV